MANSSGLYGLTFEKMFINTLALDLEVETNNGGLLVDTETPNFNTDAFRTAIDEVATGGNYTEGGVDMTTTDVTVSGDFVTFDCDNFQWASSTITARGLFTFYDSGTEATDALISNSDFGQNYVSTNGNFDVTVDGSGLWRIDIAI